MGRRRAGSCRVQCAGRAQQGRRSPSGRRVDGVATHQRRRASGRGSDRPRRCAAGGARGAARRSGCGLCRRSGRRRAVRAARRRLADSHAADARGSDRSVSGAGARAIDPGKRRRRSGGAVDRGAEPVVGCQQVRFWIRWTTTGEACSWPDGRSLARGWPFPQTAAWRSRLSPTRAVAGRLRFRAWAIDRWTSWSGRRPSPIRGRQALRALVWSSGRDRDGG